MGKKVFSVYMGDPDSSSHSELDLPATPWELIDALDKPVSYTHLTLPTILLV